VAFAGPDKDTVALAPPDEGVIVPEIVQDGGVPPPAGLKVAINANHVPLVCVNVAAALPAAPWI
jgi:hypothetical protein